MQVFLWYIIERRRSPERAFFLDSISLPMPTAKVMPALLDELYRGGARPEDIFPAPSAV